MHVRNKAELHVQIVQPEAARKEVAQAAIVHKVAIPVAAVRKAAILAAVHKVAVPVAAVRKEVTQAAIVHKVAIPVAAVHKAAILAAVRKDRTVHNALIAARKVNLALVEVSHAVTTEALRRTQLVVDPIRTKDVLMMVKVVTTAVVVVRMVVARINLWFTARRLITHLRKLSFVAA
ncbi:hypothetical protein D3C76_1169790 [compost metagenome]